MKNKKAQESSAAWSMEWFLQNILLWVIVFLICLIGIYWLWRWLRG